MNDSNFKKTIANGIYYTAIAKYSNIIISLVVVAILSRLLGPQDFGIIAIASIFIQFLSTFTSLGLEPAIIQHKELDNSDYSNLFSFTFWTGIIVTFLFFIASWPISNYYNNTNLLYICQLLTIQLFFSTINIVPNSLLYKNKEFRFIAFRSLGVQIVGGTGAIMAAMLGFGIYSLVINPIFSSIIIFVINSKKYPNKLQLSFGIQTMSKIFNYSSYQFLFGIINFFSRNLDKLIVGKFLGVGQLGFYEKSYRLMMLPLENISHVIGPVMHPVFSDFQNNMDQLCVSYEKVIKLLATIGFPLSVLLYFTGSELITLFFGPAWADSVIPFKILTFSVGTQIILATSGAIFQATNSTKTLFLCGLTNTSITVLGMLIAFAIDNSIEAIAWSISGTFILNFIFTSFILYYYIFKRKVVYLLKQLFPALLLSCILILANMILSHFINHLHPFISLLFKSGFTLIISVSSIQITGTYNLYKLSFRCLKNKPNN